MQRDVQRADEEPVGVRRGTFRTAGVPARTDPRLWDLTWSRYSSSVCGGSRKSGSQSPKGSSDWGGARAGAKGGAALGRPRPSRMAVVTVGSVRMPGPGSVHRSQGSEGHRPGAPDGGVPPKGVGAVGAGSAVPRTLRSSGRSRSPRRERRLGSHGAPPRDRPDRVACRSGVVDSAYPVDRERGARRDHASG